MGIRSIANLLNFRRAGYTSKLENEGRMIVMVDKRGSFSSKLTESHISVNISDFVKSILERSGATFPSPENGNMIVGVGGSWESLPPGSNGEILTIVGGVPVWEVPAPAVVNIQEGKGIDISGTDPYLVENRTYDGWDTAANIQALDPALHQNEDWWAEDVKIKYVSRATDVAETGWVWQPVSVNYDGLTDTFQLASTQDGQTQNIGQEVFLPVLNGSGIAQTAQNPKVFLATAIDPINLGLKSAVLAGASDLQRGDIYGLNTVDVSVSGRFKMVTYGDINGVDTSAYASNEQLYVDVVAGELTNIRPAVNAFPVAIVKRVDAVSGSIFVNSIGGQPEDTQVLPIAFGRVHFTGDEITIPGGTFYETSIEDQGTVLEATQDVIVDDNELGWVAQPHVSVPFAGTGVLDLGIYNGILEVIVNNTSANEKFYVEIYKADNNGTPVDPGTTQPNGSLGVPTITVLESAITNLDSGTTQFIDFNGILDEEVTMEIGTRLLYRIGVEKVGTQGGTRTFTFYYGSEHETFILIPAVIDAEDVNYNNTVSGLSADNVQEAIDELVATGGGGLWLENVSTPNEEYVFPINSDRGVKSILPASYTGLVYDAVVDGNSVFGVDVLGNLTTIAGVVSGTQANLFGGFTANVNYGRLHAVASNPSNNSDFRIQFSADGGATEVSNLQINSRAINPSNPGWVFYEGAIASGNHRFIVEHSGVTLSNQRPGGTASCHTWQVGGASRAEVQNDGSYNGPISLRKMKKNIVLMKDYGIDTIMELKPRKFKWKANEKEEVGFIMDEVEDIYPYATNESGELMRPYALITLLVKGIQDQQKEIEKLKKQLNG